MTGSLEGAEILMKKGTKAEPDGLTRGRGIVISSLTVGRPYNIESHRMTSLQTIPILPAKESRTARGPREECLGKRHWRGELEDGLKFRPNRVSKGARMNEVVESLRGRTVVAQ